MSSDAIIAENVSKVFDMNTVLEAGRRIVQHLKRGQWGGTRPSAHQALQGVSFRIGRGERLGIIGPNGSGKSTLLRLMMQVMQPTSGKIVTSGSIGGLIEFNAGFQPNLTAYENAVINMTMQGMQFGEAKRLAHEVFRLADLETFKHVQFKYYSSGMGVRIGFLTALMTHPDIVLLDEVLAVGDAKFRATSRKMIESFIQDRTVVFVSHNMAEIQTLCDKVVVLNKGRVEHLGDVEAGVACYQDILRVETRGSTTKLRPAAKATEEKTATNDIVSVALQGSDDGETFTKGSRVEVSVELTTTIGEAGLSLQYDVKRLGVTGLTEPVARVCHPLPIAPNAKLFATRFETTGLFPGAYLLEVALMRQGEGNGRVTPQKRIPFDVVGTQQTGPHEGADLGFTRSRPEVVTKEKRNEKTPDESPRVRSSQEF